MHTGTSAFHKVKPAFVFVLSVTVLENLFSFFSEFSESLWKLLIFIKLTGCQIEDKT